MTGPPELVRFCASCGADNPENFTQCWQCQADLSSVAALARTSPAASIATGATSGEGSRLSRGALQAELAGVLLLAWGWLLPSGVIRLVESSPSPPTLAGDLLFFSGSVLFHAGVVVLVAYLIWRDRGSLGVLGWGRISWPRELLFAAAILVALFVTGTLAGLAIDFVGLPQWETDSTPLLPRAGRLEPVLLLSGAASEEALFRGYLITRLKDVTRSPALALVLSSAAFAISHVYSPAGTLWTFVFGLVLGACFLASRRLPRLIVAHWVSNLVWT